MSTKKQHYFNLKIILAVLTFCAAVFAPLMRGLYFEQDLLPFNLFSAIFFIFALLNILLTKEMEPAFKLSDAAVFMLAAAYSLSMWHAVDEHGALKDILVYANFLILYFITWQSIQEEKDISTYINILYFSSVIIAATSLLTALGVIHFPGVFKNNILMGTFQYKNTFGIFMAMGLFLSIGQWMATENFFMKSIHAVAIYLTTISLLTSQSRASWLIYLLIITVMLFLIRNEKRDIFFLHIFFIGTALLVSRWLVPQIIAQNLIASLGIFLLGAAALVVFQYFYKLGTKFLERLPNKLQTIATVGGIIYLTLLVSIYVTYLNAAVPTVAAQFTSDEIVNRVSSIGTYDVSFEARKRYIADGFSIVKDHFLLGAGGEAWNALYHQYQPFMYWTAEVHSHILKIWLEAGLLGIAAYLLLWVSVLRMAFLTLAEMRDLGNQKRLSFLGAALLAEFIHSTFDFDFSFPGMLFFTAIGLGIMRGGYGAVYKKRKEVTYKLLIPVVIGAVLAISPFYLLASHFYNAGLSGAVAAKSLQRNDYIQAAAHFKEAHLLDPYNQNYLIDLSYTLTKLGQAKNNLQTIEEAKATAKEALSLSPKNYRAQAELIKIFMMQKEFPLAVAVAEKAVSLAPLNMQSYELLAQTCFNILQLALAGNDTANRDNMLLKLNNLQNYTQAQSRQTYYVSEFWQGRKVQKIGSTPNIEMIWAKTAVVKGQYGKALAIFKKYLRSPDIDVEARVWGSIAATKLNKPLRVNLSAEDKNQVNRIMSYLKDLGVR